MKGTEKCAPLKSHMLRRQKNKHVQGADEAVHTRREDDSAGETGQQTVDGGI